MSATHTAISAIPAIPAIPTVLITGCSSGFGLETARFFLDKGWRVIATMRSPREGLLPPSDRLRLLALDVTDADSIRRCVEEAGPVDALVNNAGVGLLGPLEGVALSSVREIFETNTFGTIAMTQAVLPQFRQRRAGWWLTSHLASRSSRCRCCRSTPAAKPR